MSKDERRYDVSWWDHDPQGWHLHRGGVRLWTMRRALRRLYARGWSSMSVRVSRVVPVPSVGQKGNRR